MSERKKLEFISSITIMNTPMKKQKFIVDEIIYPELHILSDDPKIGKSWMMMDMCLSIAKGEKFLGRRTEKGHVVYMALEDTFVSLQSRMYEFTKEKDLNRFTNLKKFKAYLREKISNMPFLIYI
ncbi:MAG: AAA family ATPase [Oscillospiraceae bacterium]